MKDTREFDQRRLAQILIREFPFTQNLEYFVAFSGGLDSTALLHALIQIEDIGTDRVTALHVNHQLHEDSNLWEKACERSCALWGVRCLTHHLDLSTPSKFGGVEAAARKARYSWFGRQLNEYGVLLTAHHLDDQVETVLANLFRGSGVHGLKGIVKKRDLGRGQVWRPLLHTQKEALHRYASSRRLHWIEDPANEDHRYSRNIIRHAILPLIKKTWPGVDRTISRSAANWRDASFLLHALAEQDLASCAQCKRSVFFLLAVTGLCKLTRLRCRNALQFWFRQCGFDPPSRRHLISLYDTMIATKPKATAVASWPGVEVRRYRDWLYLSPPLSRASIPNIHWDKTYSRVRINERSLSAVPAKGRGMKKTIFDNRTIIIKGRLGGERCWLPGHSRHHKLKKLLQQEGVPPWERDQIPLVYVDNELAAVVGYWYCQPFAAEVNEAGIEFRLSQPEEKGKNRN